MGNFLIIGGSSGIGKSIVELLEKDKHQVYASYNLNNAENRQDVIFFKHNVLTDALDLDMLPEVIDGFVYCPGSINLKPFKRFKKEDFIEDFKLQVIGATDIINLILPRLKNSFSPSILFFSTVAVQQGFDFHSQVSISKGAIEGLTKSLASEFSPYIRVNAIAPALTNTKMAQKLLNSKEKIDYHSNKNPLKRIGEANDIAETACFLLSSKSSWITGQIISVDGGFSTINK